MEQPSVDLTSALPMLFPAWVPTRTNVHPAWPGCPVTKTSWPFEWAWHQARGQCIKAVWNDAEMLQGGLDLALDDFERYLHALKEHKGHNPNAVAVGRNALETTRAWNREGRPVGDTRAMLVEIGASMEQLLMMLANAWDLPVVMRD